MNVMVQVAAYSCDVQSFTTNARMENIVLNG